MKNSVKAKFKSLMEESTFGKVFYFTSGLFFSPLVGRFADSFIGDTVTKVEFTEAVQSIGKKIDKLQENNNEKFTEMGKKMETIGADVISLKGGSTKGNEAANKKEQ